MLLEREDEVEQIRQESDRELNATELTAFPRLDGLVVSIHAGVFEDL